MNEPTRGARPLLSDVLGRLVASIAEKLDKTVGWDRLPPKLGVVTLFGIRQRLRTRNLYAADASEAVVGQAERVSGPLWDARSLDGRYNDPADPEMGAVGTAFGRNAPPVAEDESVIDCPSALEVSQRLLTRDEFFPAETLNLLAAAWVQFEVHDWFAHRADRSDNGYAARATVPTDEPSDPPPLERAPPDDHGRYRPFLSDQTHWWDASQLYGAQESFAQAIREGDTAKLKVGDELLEAMEPFTLRSGGSAAVPNLWVGSALLHMLFAEEHNAICDELRAEYGLEGQRLYEKARLINAAIMAKIHTVEWTPAIIAHPTTVAGIRATWWGVLGEAYKQRFGRVGPDELLSGIPGSRRSHDGVPYALTEEFVTVYRLHPLIPDDVTFQRVADDAQIVTLPFADLAVARGNTSQPRTRLKEIAPADAFYSLGIAHPGEITLHNYPKFFQEFKPVDDEGMLNLGAVDILRSRQTGVPRYNNFRRLFRLAPASSFHEIANGNPKWAKEIKDVYEGNLERVDALVGMFAERKPNGFAFSDTAFRVFLLMAARRLRSDRFFTTDYTPEVYTPLGLKRIDDTTLAGMLRTHYPELGTALSSVTNPFRPWRKAPS